ncbi:FecR domain-containing protein [Mucilaginibacter sp. PAMB04274]|uniref:FecR family protein n=1 Tax=Mucilaginibacter sp. PAMB04274 TaxID=3138568 RepID=UPI0031F6E28E
MDREEYLKLAAKYLNGECTPEEEAALMSYSDGVSLDDDQTNEIPAKHLFAYKQLKGKIDNHLQKTKVSSNSSPRYFKWIGVAAAVLVFALGALSIFYSPRPAAITQITYKPKNPVVNKGTALILADGEQVDLNSSKSQSLNNKSAQIELVTKGHIKYREGVVTDEQPLVYHTVATPVGEHYELELSDGSKIWLNAQSSVKFPVLFNKSHRDIEISGEAYFEVAKNKAAPFTVSVNGTAIRVLGTHFNVSAYPGEHTVNTTLLEGSVELVAGDHKTLLSPGKIGIVDPVKQSFKVEDADIDQTMAWKGGLFVFRDENICEVMKIAARWYGVNIEVADDVKTKTFGGTVSQNRSLTDFMELIKLTGGINYKITGRKVTVMK